jgi:hypothetical protein
MIQRVAAIPYYFVCGNHACLQGKINFKCNLNSQKSILLIYSALYQKIQMVKNMAPNKITFLTFVLVLSCFPYLLTAQTGTVPDGLNSHVMSVELTGLANTEFQETADPTPSYSNGFLWQFSIGTLAGNKNKQNMNGVPGIMMATSYRFTERISLGIGLGIEVMEYTTAPLYADFKFHPPVNRSYSPYLYANAGKSLPIRNPSGTGGFMSGAGAGVLFPGGTDVGWYLQAGFRYNELRTEIPHGWGNRQSVMIQVYHRLELRLGVYFN